MIARSIPYTPLTIRLRLSKTSLLLSFSHPRRLAALLLLILALAKQRLVSLSFLLDSYIAVPVVAAVAAVDNATVALYAMFVAAGLA